MFNTRNNPHNNSTRTITGLRIEILGNPYLMINSENELTFPIFIIEENKNTTPTRIRNILANLHLGVDVFSFKNIVILA